MSQRQPVVMNAGQLQQLQSADYANIGIPYFMYKNRVLNGDFYIWQRGTSLNTITTTNTYYPDQWVYTFDGSTPYVNVQREAFTVGQTSVPDDPLYYCECSVSGSIPSGQTFSRMSQRIEGVQTFQGQSATISLWAKADTTRSVSVAINQNFGTGGSPSSTVNTSGTTFSLTTSWAKYTYTFAVPSISGKTLGTSGNGYLELVLGLPINSAFTIDIAHIQFEQGSNATQFEYRNIEHDLLMCQRYFFVGGIGGNGIFYVSTAAVTNLTVPVPMRATPTLAIVAQPIINAPSVGQWTASGATVAYDAPGFPVGGVTTIVDYTGFSGATAGKPAFVFNNCTSLSAEL